MSSELTTLGLDSLSLVEYAFDLENSLQIQLTDLPHALTTIGDLVRYVDQVRRRTGTSLAA
jgi:acyl carrier protein